MLSMGYEYHSICADGFGHDFIHGGHFVWRMESQVADAEPDWRQQLEPEICELARSDSLDQRRFDLYDLDSPLAACI
jgi:hypothetical protein